MNVSKISSVGHVTTVTEIHVTEKKGHNIVKTMIKKTENDSTYHRRADQELEERKFVLLICCEQIKIGKVRMRQQDKER